MTMKRYVAIRQNRRITVCMNYTGKLSKNGRITIPKELREKHGWTEGTRLKWVIKDGNIEIIGSTMTI
jgi:AbrB family looped-hinge helix DNA binding protein